LSERPLKKDLLLPFDDTAQRAAKQIIRTARHAALGTTSPDHGGPMVSRVNLATTIEGSLFFLISGLAAHFKALEKDTRASLLVGDIGKGDPLAHPRITLNGNALRIDDSAQRDQLRRRFLAKHPKSELYIDLPDFAFWKFQSQEVSINGGFARAYAPEPLDLQTDMSGVEQLCDLEASAVEHMNEGHQDAIDHYATLAGQSGSGWRLISLDPEGLDLAKGDVVTRLWFAERIGQASELRPKLIKLASRQ